MYGVSVLWSAPSTPLRWASPAWTSTQTKEVTLNLRVLVNVNVNVKLDTQPFSGPQGGPTVGRGLHLPY